MGAHSSILNRESMGDSCHVSQLGGEEEMDWRCPIYYFLMTLLSFMIPQMGNVKYLNWTFMWFEAISSIKIDLEGSELIPNGEIANMEELTRVLWYRVGTLPSRYLSLLL